MCVTLSVDVLLPSGHFSMWLLVFAQSPSVVGFPMWKTDQEGPGFSSAALWLLRASVVSAVLGMAQPTGGSLTGTLSREPSALGAPVTSPSPSPCAPCSSFYLVAISDSLGVPSLPMSQATPQKPYLIQNLGFL